MRNQGGALFTAVSIFGLLMLFSLPGLDIRNEEVGDTFGIYNLRKGTTQHTEKKSEKRHLIQLVQDSVKC